MIIYSKITNHRKKEYQIITKIIKDNNSLYVTKQGIYNNNHIDNMIKSYELLSKYYPVVKCFKENNYIKYYYIQGDSLEDLMNTGNINKALDIYSKIINNENNLTSFYLTESFINLFGNISYTGQAFKTSNIDLTLSNIILTENGPAIIDYEWTVDYPVPKDLIVYRALCEYFNKNPDSSTTLDYCMKKLNIKYNSEFDKAIATLNTNIEDNSILTPQKEHYILNAINESHKEIKRLNNHIDNLGTWGNSLDYELKDKNNLLKETENIIKNLQENNDIKNTQIRYLNNKIEKYSNYIQTLNIKIRNQSNYLNEKIKELDQLIINNNNLTKEINKLNIEINKHNNTIETLNIKLKDTTYEVDNTNNELAKIKSSTIYKLSLKYYKLRDSILPLGSRRRLAIKLLIKAIKHPIWFIKNIKLNNIKKFIKYSKSEGRERVVERLDIYKNNNTPKQTASLELFEMKNRKHYPTLILPEVKYPVVSIIIPVYNQFSYTYGCIESIIQNTKEIDYEIIIGDDCSNDETINIEKYFQNIKVNRNNINHGFLLNCKNAAAIAKGKYLLFLNNDTNVQWNWLKSLLETIESNENIGMVGSKLVYPNGKLQEAGGILWKDGSAWNYGNKSDPEASEYNYRKAVDYISGASIMLSKKLWDEINGFDESFCPAYCEDSDLALTIKYKGYNIIYDPFSIVVHYEGISNGTNLNQGMKKHQITNTTKLYNKWHNELLNHYPNGENVFIARENGKYKKYILIIDHYVPQYDKDAGSKTVFSYIKLFCELGYIVKFIGENFYKHEPYTKELQKLGVEVLYGPYYANNWKSWISVNGKYFDYVFFNRPHITIKFLDIIKKHCNNSKLIYYGHDLHFLRSYREYELKNNEVLLIESKKWKDIEYKIFNQVDLIYYPSSTEVDYLLKEHIKNNIKLLQPYFYEINEYINYNPKYRKGILFVGGFNHSPNLDGIMWFINDIMPKILTKNKNLQLFIAGSNPPQELLNKASKNIIIKGYISDNELTKLYRSVRLVIVPLRYGAGIKGKVIEAMANNVPVITTTCGAEGINTSAIKIDDSMNSLLSYYNDYIQLDIDSKKEYEYIKNNYSKDSAKQKIIKDFNELGALQ